MDHWKFGIDLTDKHGWKALEQLTQKLGWKIVGMCFSTSSIPRKTRSGSIMGEPTELVHFVNNYPRLLGAWSEKELEKKACKARGENV